MYDRLIAELSTEDAQLLDLAYDELEIHALSVRDYQRLTDLIFDHDAYSIGDLLRLPLSKSLGARVERLVRGFLDRHRSELQPGPAQVEAGAASEVAPGMPRQALLAWARQHHVAELLKVDAALMLPQHVLYQYGVYWAVTVEDVITGRAGSNLSRRGWPRPLQELLIRDLREKARWIRACLDREAAATWRDTPPEHPTLRELWSQARDRRDTLRRTQVPRGLDRVSKVGLEDDPPAILLAWEHRFTAKIGLEPVAVPIPHEPAYALAMLDRLLDLLTSPEDAPLRARLEQALAIPRWERDLNALATIAAPSVPDPADDKNLLCWRLTDQNGRIGLTPARARETKRGGLQTRSATLNQVRDLLANPVDATVHEVLSEVVSGSEPGRARVLEALELLVGHPRVLQPDRSPAERIPVRRGRLRVAVTLEGGEAKLALTLDEAPLSLAELRQALQHNLAGGRLAIVREDAVWVARVRGEVLARIEPWLARDARIPLAAHDRLLDLVHQLGSHVPVVVPPALRGVRLDGDRRPLLLLHWEEQGALVVEARVRPVPELAPDLPGEGSPTLFVRRGGRRSCVERDLDHEPAQIRDLLAPLELPDRAAQGPFAWRLGALQEALGVVERLQRRLEAFQVEWRGDVPRVAAPIAARDVRVQVAEGRDWFGVKGVVRLESGAVDLDALLRSIGEGHDYVQVGAGTFARVDKALRAQLAALSDGGEDTVSPLLAPVVRALEEAGAEVEVPVQWHTLLDRLQEARTLEAPVPPGLQATLRDYQLDGFRWLAALAHWAPGAVLADDMGLGKTVQSIALLLRRAGGGPALVVAPASVVFNWEREIGRFAPDLAVRVHHGSARGEALLDLGPRDVVLTTYGVLVRDAAALAAIPFATAVLDEAQAIKNPTTQRSAAAFGLDAGFRLALSGTPVENRVTELWSLFRFVAPGLLGAAGAFHRRFVEPIEGRGDVDRRATLASLVRPFVLRRAKEQVERELPALTESVLRVQLSPAERNLYETARVRAVARIVGLSTAEKRLRVLQELLQLRQLACHPRLVDPGSDVPSSKLRQLRRLIADLRENGHRALVFSQFVRHLTLVREALDADGVRYRYLDGSTPLAARRAEVDAFQSGDGDVFLISLEAGGVGLNLTAANYVVHLDPWWNPAKEDQATDRAHRIGQERPVTVYRLVSEGTIEEQILELHAQKRELAEALLAGTDVATRTTTEELLALLADATPSAHPADARAASGGAAGEASAGDPGPDALGRPRLALIASDAANEGVDRARGATAPATDPSVPVEPSDGDGRSARGRPKLTLVRSEGGAPPVQPAEPPMVPAASASTTTSGRSAGSAGSAGSAASAEAGLDLEGLYARYVVELEAALARGDLAQPATVRAYRAALRHIVDDVAPRGPEDLRSFVEMAREYVRRATDGEVTHKADRVYARPALNRFLTMLGKAGA